MFPCRVNSYITNGWATQNLINPDECNGASAPNLMPSLEFNGKWTNIINAYSQPEEVPLFNHGHMISYFVSRTAVDDLASGDVKSINNSAKYLYDCGHIQDIEVGYSSTSLHLRATCIPEMRKDRVYKVIMTLDCKTYDIITATCGCPAGKGTTASCKHVGALCYALVEFCTSGKMPDFLTCTDKLQAWNRPKPKKVNPIPVTDFSKRKMEITKKHEKKQSITEYDPRPPSMQVDNPSLLENLRISLLQSSNASAFLQLLVAPEHIAMHDHTYCSKHTSLLQPTYSQSNTLQEEVPSAIQVILDSVSSLVFTREDLNISLEERDRIEGKTREQAQSPLWYLVRARRITASLCGKIICQKEMTPALLMSVLYPKPFEKLPAPIKWGIDNEPKANREYLNYAKAHGKKGLSVRKCGFIVHPTMGWLGASPDAHVTDPHSDFPDGIAEFKCPFSKKELTPREACDDPNFYCYYDSGLHLKKSHHYYHQVQLQLFVGIDQYDWCDFCVYTPKGIEVERIWLDIEWSEKCITELDSYYEAYILPEILHPSYKPSYIL